MKLNDDVYVLPLPMARGDQTVYFNASLLLDASNGAALVDTGLPGQSDAIAAALAEAGVQIGDLKRIILTHQDIDHVGSLHDLVQASGARVLASAVETPFIDGTELPRFARPEILAQRPDMRAVAERFQPTHVDEQLQDGARLDLAGGARIVFTPGHTPGHMCLYLERSKTLIAGDALTASEGRLHGPSPDATQDMAQAAQSVQKLAALDVATIVCYHGGVVDEDANEQLRRVAQELNQG
ncbi:MAG TPA: MBL fold metallo-hydrolase [Roseiflexaceae bacterium]|jgi:glyoxylase-like metal-dependent hydrolase (beta-lactamase superfamily II)|nr:MBL fold metallo-hydrolase [Roseiflexaceae bacterium]